MEGRPQEPVSRERELALRARGGDTRAYEELVRPHQEIAFRVAYVITRNAADAEDATQDGLVKAWRAIRRFRVGEPLRPWLLRIVANEARNRRRSSRRREQLALRAAEISGEAAPSPEDAALAAGERARLLEALEQLPVDARDLSEEETASALDLRRGTVKSRTSRALDRLKESLGGGSSELGEEGGRDPE